MSDKEAGEAFWRFSLALYEQPGVPEACLALQDEHGLDVNLVLWLLWIGWSGRGRLTADDLARADAHAASWRRDVIVPLRSVRRALKGSPDAGAEALRNNVKTAELESERLQHHRLGDLAASPRQREDAVGDAEANLALYVGRDVLQGTVLLDAVRSARRTIRSFDAASGFSSLGRYQVTE